MLHSAEPLEARIAPATLTGRTLSYTDIDGDQVKITFTLGTYAETDFTFDTANFGDPGPQQLQSLNFSGDTDKDKTSIAMKVTRVAGGDGQAHIGWIDATDIDLGTVSILGDLGRINAGDDALETAGVKALKVASMGVFGADTQGGAGSVTSNVVGSLGSLTVKGHIFRAEFNADSFGKITVGGSLFGGSVDYSGQLYSRGAIGDVTIKGDIFGSSGSQSAQVSAAGEIGKVVVGGSIIGGSGGDPGERFYGSGMIISGRTAPGDITSITIGGRVEGGTGFGSGSIVVGRSNPGDVGAITIQGSLVGSFGDQSGSIWVDGTTKSLSIGGSILAETGHYDADSDGTGDPQGQVYIQENLGSLTVKGDLKGGTGHSAARVFVEGSIGPVKIGGSLIAGTGEYQAMVSSEKSIGAVTIGRDIDGRLGTTAPSGITAFDNIASVTINGSVFEGRLNANDQLGAVTIKGSVFDTKITARGQMVPGATTDLAIKSIKIGGSIYRSQILGGYDSIQISPMSNGDAQIGAVTVGGDWVATDLVSGVQLTGTFYGDGDDLALTSNPGLFSRIASVTIKGTLLGTDTTINNNADHFGFEAQEIGAFSVGGQKIKLTAKVQDAAVTFSPITVNDVTLIEHAV